MVFLDIHGHLVGDEVLTTIARGVRDCIRHGDTAARVGGDEFVLVLNGISDGWDAQQFFARLTPVLRVEVTPMLSRAAVSPCRSFAG